MKRKNSRLNGAFALGFLLFVSCAPVAAQYTDRLGGNWNNPASAMITNIVMDRLARRRLERRLGVKHTNPNGAKTPSSSARETAASDNDAAVHFRSTGTQLKTREIANLLEIGRAS